MVKILDRRSLDTIENCKFLSVLIHKTMGCDFYENIRLEVTLKNGDVITEHYENNRRYDLNYDDYKRHYHKDSVIYDGDWQIKNESAQKDYEFFIRNCTKIVFDDIVKITKRYSYSERD